MNKTTVLWLRLMTAAQKVGTRHGWRAAQRVLGSGPGEDGRVKG